MVMIGEMYKLEVGKKEVKNILLVADFIIKSSCLSCGPKCNTGGSKTTPKHDGVTVRLVLGGVDKATV